VSRFSEKDVVGLRARDAARARSLHLQLGRTALAMFRDKHVVSHLKVRRPLVRLVVVILNSSLALTNSFLRHLCVDLRHNLRKLPKLHKILRLDQSELHVDRDVILQHQRERGRPACPVKNGKGVFLFSLVDRELKTLCTKLTTSGHSSAYIFN
jgi:hypothetical protein